MGVILVLGPRPSRAALILSIGLVFTAWPAAAQPELWSTDPDAGAVSVHDSATGVRLRQFTAPAGICIGEGTLSHDRRVYWVPTNIGFARFDVASREFIELVPHPMTCNTRAYLSPTGRWWHIVVITISGKRLAMVDVITRQEVRNETVPNSDVRMVFDGSRRYELRSEVGRPVATLSAWIEDAPSSRLWTTNIDGPAGYIVNAPFVAQGDSVYLAQWMGDGTVQVRRYDAATGEVRASVSLLMSSTRITPRHLTLYRGLLYASFGNDAMPLPDGDRQSLLMLDIGSLNELARVEDSNPGAFDQMFLTAALKFQLRRACQETSCVTMVQPVVVQVPPRPPSLALGAIHDLGIARAAGAAPSATDTPFRVSLVEVRGGDRIRVAWQPDPRGPDPRSFEIFGRGAFGDRIRVAVLDASARAWDSPELPAGRYTLWVRAVNEIGPGTEATADVSVLQFASPEAPRDLAIYLTNTALLAEWRPAITGSAPSHYIIEAASGGTTTFIPVAQTSANELFAIVPPGTWHVRVRGMLAGNVGPPTSPATVTIEPCTNIPVHPSEFAASTAGDRVTLRWSRFSGLAVTYVVEVGSTFGASDLARLTVSGGTTSLEIQAPVGIYGVRVRAQNACGDSAPSNEIVVRVP